MPFGYPLEADFDIAKERRRDHLKWSLAGVLVLGLLYLFFGRPFAVQVFQILFATTLYYGENFYVRRRDKFREAWFWKVLLATIPFHVLYLAILIRSDAAFPNVMPKSIVVVPVLFIGFGIESALLDSFVNRFGQTLIHNSNLVEGHPNPKEVGDPEADRSATAEIRFGRKNDLGR